MVRVLLRARRRWRNEDFSGQRCVDRRSQPFLGQRRWRRNVSAIHINGRCAIDAEADAFCVVRVDSGFDRCAIEILFEAIQIELQDFGVVEQDVADFDIHGEQCRFEASGSGPIRSDGIDAFGPAQ